MIEYLAVSNSHGSLGSKLEMFFGIQCKDVSLEVSFMFLAVCIRKLNFEVTS